MTWVAAVAIAVLAFTILSLARRIVRGHFAKLAKSTAVVWDDLVIEVLVQTKQFALMVGSLYLGSHVLALSDRVVDVLQAVVAVTVLLQIGFWGTAAVQFLLEHQSAKRSNDGAAITSMKALTLVVRLALWSIVALLVLDNLGVDITALVAGLGVGGIAVALAMQNVLGDLFASLSIVLDKPFVQGDMIMVDDMIGTVEHVGLKTTRIRSLSGEQLVFSNADLLRSRIRNHGRRAERRVSLIIGVTYDTPRAMLQTIPAMIKQAVEAQEDTRFSRSHFNEFGDSALMFETIYYVTVPHYDRYMDIQQDVNLSVHEQFEANGIEFAFPTQTVHVVAESSVG